VNPNCVVFDLDDTLYLERDYVWSGFHALEAWAKKNLGLDDFCRSAWTLFQRGERGHIFDRILVEAGIEQDRNTIQTMVDLYRGHTPEIHLAADAAECLQYLCAEVHLALVSDGPEQSQRNKLKALGLERSFEAIILTSELGAGYTKPHLKPFLEVQEHFGGAVQQYTYVADNPTKDFIGPRNLGWKTIRVRRNGGLYSYLDADKRASADVEMQDLSPLTKTIMSEQQQPSY
jgi:putative hydrolase of the HAD superfamily